MFATIYDHLELYFSLAKVYLKCLWKRFVFSSQTSAKSEHFKNVECTCKMTIAVNKEGAKLADFDDVCERERESVKSNRYHLRLIDRTPTI